MFQLSNKNLTIRTLFFLNLLLLESSPRYDYLPKFVDAKAAAAAAPAAGAATQPRSASPAKLAPGVPYLKKSEIFEVFGH